MMEETKERNLIPRNSNSASTTILSQRSDFHFFRPFLSLCSFVLSSTNSQLPTPRSLPFLFLILFIIFHAIFSDSSCSIVALPPKIQSLFSPRCYCLQNSQKSNPNDTDSLCGTRTTASVFVTAREPSIATVRQVIAITYVKRRKCVDRRTRNANRRGQLIR